MIYVTVVYNTKKRELFGLLEPFSESKFTCTVSDLAKLIELNGMKLINADIEDNNVYIHEWPSGLVFGFTKSVLLAEISKNKFLMYNNAIYEIDWEQFSKKIIDEKVSNCQPNPVTHTIDFFDTLKGIEDDIYFKDTIDQKYKAFMAKSRLLGIDSGFTYNIIGHNVILVDYTGESTSAIVPSFITHIKEKAFRNIGITEIKLSEGLQVIGNRAFVGNHLTRVDIPASVKLVGAHAFYTYLDKKYSKQLEIIYHNDNTVKVEGYEHYKAEIELGLPGAD